MPNSIPPSELPDPPPRGSGGSRPDIVAAEQSELDVGLAAAFGERTGSGRILNRSNALLLAGAVIADKYKLIEQIGEGGMGTVWYAEQLAPIKRKAALKLIKPGMDSHAVIARFDAERQALALMDHPNIAKVFDGGMTEQERPYFVMELVRGTAITAFCDERRLNLHERLQLFIPVCQAIQHAHQKGIIHRDIKPSNVLVALYDDKPVPKVIDFGVAKATATALTEHSLHTGFGAVVGTAEYMSPEQAQLNNVDIDTRSDIYSLGVLLYELLAGSPPFRRAELEARGALEILRVVREVDPPRPSMKLSTSKTRASIAAVRNSDPKSLGKLLRSDLDWIVMKSLEKDRARRYETANGLARDIERFLTDEPVEACPPSAGYKLRKFVHRNRSRVIAATVLLLTLVVGVIGTTYGLVRAEAARRAAERAEDATLESYRASTDDAIEQLIGSKAELGPHERAYLEKTLRRWQAFADRKGNDERSRAIRAEGHFRVARIWDTLGQNAEAQSEYERAIVIWEQLVADFPDSPMYPHEYAHSRRDLGLILQRLGNHEAAEEQFRLAQVIQEKLVAGFPAVAKYRLELARIHETLGNQLGRINKLSEAEQQIRQALAILVELVADFPDVSDHCLSLASCHNNLAYRLEDRAPAEAEDHYRKALPILEKLAADLPSVPIHRLGIAKIQTNLGRLLAERGKLSEAEELFRKSLAMLQSLAREFPSVPVYRSQLAVGHQTFGWFLREKLARTAEGEKELHQGLVIYEKLVNEFPLVPNYRSELANGYFTLGYMLTFQGRMADGEEFHRKAIRIREELATEFPTVPDFKVDLGDSYGKLGELLRVGGKPADSLVWIDKAIATILPVYEAAPQPGPTKECLRESLMGRAEALALLHQDSNADWEKVLEFIPTDGPPQNRIRRARVQLQAGQLAAAVAEVEALTTAAADSSNAHPLSLVEWYDAACFYSVASQKSPDHQSEYADRAMAALTEAVEAGFADAAHINQDADMDPLRGRDDFKKLIEELSNRNPE